MKLIKHELAGVVVTQQIDNGYINLNQIAKAAGKRVDHWLANCETQELLAEFERRQKLPDFLGSLEAEFERRQKLPDFPGSLEPALIRVEGRNGGTWAHPDIAIAFAQWCSPIFTLQVSRWVREWMTTGQSPLRVADPVTINDPLLELIEADMRQVRVAAPFVLAWKYDALKALNPHRAEMLDSAKRLVMSNCAEEESLINPTNIGKLIEERTELKVPGAYVNTILEALEYQQKSQTAKCRWVLTEKGEQYGRAVPYKNDRTGHEGYQILWMTGVVEPIVNYLKSQSA